MKFPLPKNMNVGLGTYWLGLKSVGQVAPQAWTSSISLAQLEAVSSITAMINGESYWVDQARSKLFYWSGLQC